MDLRTALISELPAPKNKKEMIVFEQGEADLIREILRTHAEFSVDYDCLYPYFDTNSLYTTCQQLWQFLYRDLKYDAESKEVQTVRSPGMILKKGTTLDCKHYSLFIAGVLDAIKRNENETINWWFRFASYNSDPVASHVFVVAADPNNDCEIWIDPVLKHFDEHKQPTFFVDRYPLKKKAMPIYKLSGIDDTLALPVVNVTVNKKDAEIAFLQLLRADINLFPLKKLFFDNYLITDTLFKKWYKDQGYDYNAFLAILHE